jgi:CheY-like chemotaxis protein
MNGILGLTELALQTVGQPEQVSYLQNAFQSARSLMGILNDVLDLAKIESGKMTLAEESFSFPMMLHPVVAPAIQQCKAKGVQFVCSVAASVPDMVIGDAMRLRQIVSNLVSNACKFTHKGRIEVEASAEDIAGECFSLVLHVRDTGIGIAPDQIGRIFDAFEQGDRSDSRRYGGTGLGLAICLNLAHLMGGEIEATSKLGEGSDFCVHIPMRREIVPIAPASGPVSPPAEPTAPGVVACQPLRILAAEDNRINRLLLGRILENAGHKAVFAENGVEALRLWENGGFDLLLMDLQMPVMDGLEAAQEIRRREAGNAAHTPIIAVTARAMHEDRELTVAAGMDGYVSKPYSAEDILTAIRSVLH